MNTTAKKRRPPFRSFLFSALVGALITLPFAAQIPAHADDALPLESPLIDTVRAESQETESSSVETPETETPATETPATETPATETPEIETPGILEPEEALPAEANPDITDNPPNQVPDANDDSYSMVQGTTLVVGAPGILANDSDPENDPLSVVEWFDYDPTELVVDPDGSFTFTPAPSFTGVSTFQYKAGAGTGWSYARTVTITVVPAELPPVAPVGVPDAYSTPMDTVLTAPANGVLANDPGAVAVVDVKDLPEGLTANFDGSFSYFPPAGFVGDVGFSYRMSVGSDMLSDWIPVTIAVTPIISQPPRGSELPPGNESPLTNPSTLANTGGTTPLFLGPAALLLIVGASGMWLVNRRRPHSAL